MNRPITPMRVTGTSRVFMMRLGGWSMEQPIDQLQRWIDFHDRMAKRVKPKYAAQYIADAEALRDFQRAGPKRRDFTRNPITEEMA